MKTSLILEIDDKILTRAKEVSAYQNVSLSSVVEEYLEDYTKKERSVTNEVNNEGTLLDRIRKFTKNALPPEENFDPKKAFHDHIDEKYGS